MAASSISSTPTLIPAPLGKISEVVTSTVVATVQAIVQENQYRIASYPNDVTQLNKGIFYGSEYMKALEAQAQHKRLKFLREKGSFSHGYASPKHFDMPPSSDSVTGIKGNCFVIKPGVRPSEGILAMRDGISLIGCGETSLLGLFEGLKAAWGTEKFDTLFARESGTPLIIQFNNWSNPILSLLTKELFPTSFVKGRIYHFTNAPDYMYKHQNGEANGYSTLCVDDTPGKEKFTTLGLNSEGMTREEISAVLLKELNKTPIGMEIVTDEVAKRIMAALHPLGQERRDSLRDKQYSLEEFQSKRGGSIQLGLGLNMKVITLIASQPIDKALSLFQRLNQERTLALRAQGII